MSGSEAIAGGEAEAITVGIGEPLLPLQDPWYCLTSLFPVVGALEVSPHGVPRKWILKDEALSHETT